MDFSTTPDRGHTHRARHFLHYHNDSGNNMPLVTLSDDCRQLMWIFKQGYNECSPSIVHHKCCMCNDDLVPLIIDLLILKQ